MLKEEIISKNIKSNAEYLRMLRAGNQFDVLEVLLHQLTMAIVINKLTVKIKQTEKKNPGADVKEQYKMVEDLAQVQFWMDGMQRQHDALKSRYYSVERGIKDLMWINEVHLKKIEELEKQIKIYEDQQSF